MTKAEKISRIIEFIQKCKPLLGDDLIEEYDNTRANLTALLNDEIPLVDPKYFSEETLAKKGLTWREFVKAVDDQLASLGIDDMVIWDLTYEDGELATKVEVDVDLIKDGKLAIVAFSG